VEARVVVSVASVACLACFASTGCSSDSSADSHFDKNDFDVVMSQDVIPALRLLNPLRAFPGISAQTAPQTASSCPQGSEDLSSAYCTSGSVCRAPSAGGTTTTFSACSVPGSRLDGTWTVTGAPNANTSTIDLTINVLGLAVATLHGTIEISAPSVLSACWQVDIGSIAVHSGPISLGITGLLTYCIGHDWPAGSREVVFTDTAHDLSYELTLDQTDHALVTIKDHSSGHTLATCTTALDSATSVCSKSAL
jgi:hypothetical protein